MPSVTAVSSKTHLPGNRRWLVCLGIGAFGLAAVCGFICYFIAGNALDLFLAGFCFAALLVPPLTAIAGRQSGVWLTCSSVVIGTALVWLIPVGRGSITFGQWLLCLLVLLSFVLAMGATLSLLISVGLPASATSAIITLLALAWLTWPIWLSASIAGSHPDCSVRLHPLFAVNHVLVNLGIWTEQQVAYNLTNLGQDVPYQLPGSIWPVVLFQLSLAMIANLLSWALSRQRRAA